MILSAGKRRFGRPAATGTGADQDVGGDVLVASD
jgi:hypothetical protein